MKNICDWNNCNEIGEYRAPIEKDNSRKYRMLCLEHVKEFNKNWNYFSGMSDNQVINFLKSDMTWQRHPKKQGIMVRKMIFGSTTTASAPPSTFPTSSVSSCNKIQTKLTINGEIKFEIVDCPRAKSASPPALRV